MCSSECWNTTASYAPGSSAHRRQRSAAGIDAAAGRAAAQADRDGSTPVIVQPRPISDAARSPRPHPTSSPRPGGRSRSADSGSARSALQPCSQRIAREIRRWTELMPLAVGPVLRPGRSRRAARRSPAGRSCRRRTQNSGRRSCVPPVPCSRSGAWITGSPRAAVQIGQCGASASMAAMLAHAARRAVHAQAQAKRPAKADPAVDRVRRAAATVEAAGRRAPAGSRPRAAARSREISMSPTITIASVSRARGACAAAQHADSDEAGSRG